MLNNRLMHRMRVLHRDKRAPAPAPRICILSPGLGAHAGGIGSFSESLFGVVQGLENPRVRGNLVGQGRRWHLQRGKVICGGGGGSRRALAQAIYVLMAWLVVSVMQPDVVDAVTWRAAVPALIAPRFRTRALVVRCLGSELNRAPGLMVHLRDWVLRKADRLVAISSFTSDVVEDMCGIRPLVIPPIVENPREGGKVGRSLGDGASGAHGTAVEILSIARLVRRKGHLELVKAVYEVRRRGLDLRLTIAGAAGPVASEIDQMKEQLSADWLSKEVDVSRERIEELYEIADVFALLTEDAPGEFEGFGIVLADAGFRGLPVVVRRSGGVEDVVLDGQTGIVVTDTAEAANALERLSLDAALRTSLGTAARKHVQKFSSGEVASALGDLYGQLLESTT